MPQKSFGISSTITLNPSVYSLKNIMEQLHSQKTFPKKRNWRLIRNWFVALSVWVGFAIMIIFVVHSLYHLIWIVPLYVLGVITLRVFRLIHPRAIDPVPFCYVRWPLTPDSPRTNSCRFPKIDPASIPDMKPITIENRAGLTLAGHFISGNNRAIIIMLHGAGTEGMNVLPQAIALHNRGYNILLMDLRAHGKSEGDTSTLGWSETDDLLDTVGYVQKHDGIDADKIGVFGFSMGGQIGLRTSAKCQAIRGIVADSTSPASLEDYRGDSNNPWRWVIFGLNFFTIRLTEWMIGRKAPTGVLKSVEEISPRPMLLISTGRGKERLWGNRIFKAAREPKDIWEIPEALHGEGFKLYPEKYSEKLGSFFDEILF